MSADNVICVQQRGKHKRIYVWMDFASNERAKPPRGAMFFVPGMDEHIRADQAYAWGLQAGLGEVEYGIESLPPAKRLTDTTNLARRLKGEKGPVLRMMRPIWKKLKRDQARKKKGA